MGRLTETPAAQKMSSPRGTTSGTGVGEEGGGGGGEEGGGGLGGGGGGGRGGGGVWDGVRQQVAKTGYPSAPMPHQSRSSLVFSRHSHKPQTTRDISDQTSPWQENFGQIKDASTVHMKRVPISHHV